MVLRLSFSGKNGVLNIDACGVLNNDAGGVHNNDALRVLSIIPEKCVFRLLLGGIKLSVLNAKENLLP